MVALLLALQSAQWTVRPPIATVGDTVVIERLIDVASPGVRARVSAVEQSAKIEPLGEPDIRIAQSGILVRHVVAVFAPGTLQVQLPAIELLHADGSFETADGGMASVIVRSVLPAVVDSNPTPRPSLAPIGRLTKNRNLPVLLPLAVILLSATWGVLRRRRRPRPGWVSGGSELVEAPVERWIQAGEPRAVAALAMTRIRERLQEIVPEANAAMSNQEVLSVLSEKYPKDQISGLSDALLSLERASFAPAVAADVMTIVDGVEHAVREVQVARAQAHASGDA